MLTIFFSCYRVLVDMYDIFGDGGDYEWAQYDDEVNSCIDYFSSQ